jgi:inosine triphosphate pyrophosphatase
LHRWTDDKGSSFSQKVWRRLCGLSQQCAILSNTYVLLSGAVSSPLKCQNSSSSYYPPESYHAGVAGVFFPLIGVPLLPQSELCWWNLLNGLARRYLLLTVPCDQREDREIASSKLHMRERWAQVDKILQDVFFVTGNRYKLLEVESVLGKMRHIDLDLPEIQELAPRKVVIAKAQAAMAQGYCPVLIEDTSLSVVRMNGLPGPLIKWFLQSMGGEGLYRMASSLGSCEAEVRTIFGLALGPQTFIYGEGFLTGEVVAPRGGGFGWDAIFQPTDSTKTFGEMDPNERAAMSMRVKALHDLRAQLERFNKSHASE